MITFNIELKLKIQLIKQILNMQHSLLHNNQLPTHLLSKMLFLSSKFNNQISSQLQEVNKFNKMIKLLFRMLKISKLINKMKKQGDNQLGCKILMRL